ncbi:MAG: cytochrome c family protein [Alphaproteobacteria bacterium]|nr:cytochrome c family protein [Alphaproteobacteria bacterium]
MRIRMMMLALAGAGTAAWSGTALAADPGDPERGETLFKRCVACHSFEPNGRNKAGPRLHGLFGRKAGTVSDYKYSPALKDSALVWTPDTVDALFAKGPEEVVPGSKMPLQVMSNPKDRADLIAFLRKVTAE